MKGEGSMEEGASCRLELPELRRPSAGGSFRSASRALIDASQDFGGCRGCSTCGSYCGGGGASLCMDTRLLAGGGCCRDWSPVLAAATPLIPQGSGAAGSVRAGGAPLRASFRPPSSKLRIPRRRLAISSPTHCRSHKVVRAPAGRAAAAGHCTAAAAAAAAGHCTAVAAAAAGQCTAAAAAVGHCTAVVGHCSAVAAAVGSLAAAGLWRFHSVRQFHFPAAMRPPPPSAARTNRHRQPRDRQLPPAAVAEAAVWMVPDAKCSGPIWRSARGP